MKKVILSGALMGLCLFASCNSDDNNDNDVLSRCMVCTTDLSGQSDEYTLCRDDFNTQEQYDEAVEAAQAIGSCTPSN